MKQPVKEGDGQDIPKDVEVNEANEANETEKVIQSDPNYGLWMIVTRKKSANRVGRSNGSTKTNHVDQSKSKGSSVHSHPHALETEAENLEKSSPSDSADSVIDTTRVGAAQLPQQSLEMENDCVIDECKDSGNNKYLQGPRQHFEGKGKALHKFKAKGNKGLGIKSTKNLKSSKSLPRPTFSAGEKSGQVDNGVSFGRDDLNTKKRDGPYGSGAE